MFPFKSAIKTWLLTNMFELSTYIGFFFLLRELMLYNSSTLVIILSLVLIFTPDTKLRNFMLKYADGLKKLVERW